MDKFLKTYLGLGLAAAGTVVSLVVAYLVYKEVNKTPEERAAEKARKEAEAKAKAIDERRENVEDVADAAYGRTPLNKAVDYLKVVGTLGLYVPPRLSGGPPVNIRGTIILVPGNKVILVNDIVAQGGSIQSRSDGTFDFRYNNQTYTLQESSTRPDGARIASLRPAGVTR